MSASWHDGRGTMTLASETANWMRLAPRQRWAETIRLSAWFHALGGTGDPDSDPSSPFYTIQQYGVPALLMGGRRRRGGPLHQPRRSPNTRPKSAITPGAIASDVATARHCPTASTT